MPEAHTRFGADLWLLRDLEQQVGRLRGEDLEIVARSETGAGHQFDLAVLDGAENLQQALLLRFLTPAGELAPLGHPEYGSRLYTLLGELNTETTRNRAKLFALQALQAEPRVAEILSLEVTTRRTDPTRIDINAAVRAIDGDKQLNFVFPFFLDGGTTP